jgi:hypothetical protein
MTAFGAQNPTSYFSAPSSTLDPELFDGNRLKPQVRNALLELVYSFLGKHFTNPQSWAEPWIAGSGASYQWAAAREPGDLDILVGVDYVAFRRTNPRYQGLSDKEISEDINEKFRTELQPHTERWTP